MEENSRVLSVRWATAGLVCIIGVAVILALSLRQKNANPSIVLPFTGNSLCFDSTRQRFLVVHHGVIDVRNLEDNTHIVSLRIPGDPITALACDNERMLAYCGTKNGSIKRLDLEKLQFSDEVSLGFHIFDLAIDPQRRQIVVSSFDGTQGILSIIGLANGRLTWQKRFSWIPTSFTISRDGMILAFPRGGSKSLHVLTLGNGNEHVENFQDDVAVSDLLSTSFCGQSHILAIGLEVSTPKGHIAGAVRLWDCDSNQEVGRITIGQEGITTIGSTDDGQTLVAGDHSGSIFICQLRPLRLIKKLYACDKDPVDRSPSKDPKMWEGPPSSRHAGAPVTRLGLSPDGRWLACACSEIGVDDNPGHGEIKVWQLDKILQNK